MSEINVNTIKKADGTGSLTVPAETGTVVTTASPSLGRRNLIINGNAAIDQRNGGSSVTPTDAQYTLDRWQAKLSQASKYSVQQSTTAPNGFSNSILITSLSAYSLGSSDGFSFRQAIEGLNLYDLGWGTVDAKTVTLSFWVRSSLTGTFGGSFYNADLSRSYPFTYTISSADTWEQKSITVVGDTSGTWLTTNGVGLYVVFGLGVGSTYSGASGSWSGNAYLSATGATSVVGTNGATWYITGVQLEVGSVATPFEHRSYGEELALCKRYFEKLTYAGGGFVNTGYAPNSSTGQCVLYYNEKRTAPTITLPSVGKTAGTISFLTPTGSYPSTVGSIATSVISTIAARIAQTSVSSLTAGGVTVLYINGGASISVDAEL